ncbi:MAG TPA: hypothetical protein VIS94_17730 [Desulfomonilia bacterium]
MEQTILDGIFIISFYIAGTVILLMAGEFICKIYEIVFPAMNRKVSCLFSSAFVHRRQRPFHGCLCRTFPVRQKG